MARIVVQMGHVPRRKGATGTHREQEFAKAIGGRLHSRLSALGHTVFVIGADDEVPSSELFVSLHCDGSTDPNRRGASVGYPDAAGGRYAAAWKDAHTKAGYPGGWHADNYTAALRGYYGFRRSNARFRFLAEHGTNTNRDDEAWLFSHLDECADAHVAAIGSLIGHPKTPNTSEEPDMTPEQAKQLAGVYGHAINSERDGKPLDLIILEEIKALRAEVAELKKQA